MATAIQDFSKYQCIIYLGRGIRYNRSDIQCVAENYSMKNFPLRPITNGIQRRLNSILRLKRCFSLIFSIIFPSFSLSPTRRFPKTAAIAVDILQSGLGNLAKF